MNPASLANFRPPFQPGDVGNPTGRPKNTPLVTPAMRRLALMPIEKLRDTLARIEFEGQVPAGFTVAEALALIQLSESLKSGPVGEANRRTTIARLDGKEPDVEVDVQVGVLVRYVSKSE